MLIRDLIADSLPTLDLHDTIYNSIQLMNDCQVSHLPLEGDGKFIGLVSEELLLQAVDETKEIHSLLESIPFFAVKQSDHFLTALKLGVELKLSIIPIIDEETKLIGVISYSDLPKHASEYLNLKVSGGIIVLEMEPTSYSIGEICRLVEKNDAQVMQLNTSIDAQTGLLQVNIKLNKTEIAEVVAAFQRYDYQVKYYFGDELFENELRNNYENLMNYLKI